jgi:hypothetical protein
MAENTAICALTIFAVIVVVGILWTKTKGFGKYTTSLLLLIIVLFLSSFFLLLGKISTEVFANVLFAVAGFSGGLLSAKKLNEE